MERVVTSAGVMRPPSMHIGRRSLLAGLPLLALATQARADTVDLSLSCDTTLAPALRKVAAAYNARNVGAGVRVRDRPWTDPAAA